MLAKDSRLNLKKDFTWVASGEKTGDNLLRLFYRFGENKIPRVGIAVSAKTFKKAVDRNKARRMVSTAFERLYSKLPEKINIVAIPKEGALNVGSSQMGEALENMLKKARILK